MDVLPHTLTEAAAGLQSKKYSATELTKAFLARIHNIESQLHSIITITEEDALVRARVADERIATGESGPLLGIPIVIKDNFQTAGVKTTAGSNMLRSYIGQYDADVVASLKVAGAVMLGKSNLDAFAHGSSTENSDFGPTFNPWNTDFVPGGSSGGSAAAVAAQECLIATGSDTGGSIRQPASFTNTVGLKPTYGRVSRYGVLAMGSSFDSIGHFTRTVEDSAVVLSAINGESMRDATTSREAPYKFSLANIQKPVKGMKIGIAEEFFGEGIDPPIVKLLSDVKSECQKLGISFVPVQLPHLKYALAAYYILVPSELSSNLSRLDGIRYGHSDQSVTSLLEVYEESREQGLGMEAKRRIMLGTYALSAGYYDAYYKRAQQVRTLVKQDFETALAKVDMLLAPVSPTLPFKVGERTKDPLAMYLSDALTVPINLAGLPSLALPAGFVDGLPVGMQLIGRQFAEEQLFQLGYQYQQQTDWHMQYARIEEKG